jgi:hypothetical protein
MPLPLPVLDTRRWSDLVDEGRALIPRYAPSWTDHNVHDPGVTLIELLAWLTEQDIYRVNRVPDRHRRKFLALIGFNPRPPRAAQAVLTFEPDAGTQPFDLPAGAEFEATGAGDKPVRFRTLRDLTVAAVELAAVRVEEVNAEGNHATRDRTGDWREGLPFMALGRNPLPGAALYLGFTDLPAQVPLALAFHFQGPGNDAAERERINLEAQAQAAACRPVLPAIACEDDAGQLPTPGDTLPPHHSAQVVWEVSTGSGANDWSRLEPVTDGARPDIGQVMDDTRSLTLDGIVEVNLPSTMEPTALGQAAASQLFYLRARLASGAYDAPPLLLDLAPNGVAVEQAVPLAQTFTIAAGVTPAGPIPAPGETTRLRMELDDLGVVQTLLFDAAALNWPDLLVLDYQPPTGVTTGQITLDLALAGVANGQPGQQVTLPEAPVQVESLQLYTHIGDVWQVWTRRDDMDASRRTELHFTLDATSGDLLFGDGERGRLPPAGALVLVSYRAMRAEKGNVAARTVTRPAATLHNALFLAGLPAGVMDQLPRITTNRLPARGGAAVEGLPEAAGRAVETLHAHERLIDLCDETNCQTLDQVDGRRVRAIWAPTRATNLLDIERLALDVPGTRVARARAWPALHPAYPCLQAPGVVTVVVIPDMPVARPEPSQGLLDAVRRYLDRRRTVGTRIEMVGPHYLEVRVRARVQPLLNASPSRVRTDIVVALNAFLDPRHGGPAGLGWPFGRDVYRSEILQLIDDVPGVDHVLELWLSSEAGEPQCGNLSLCPTWLVTPGAHEIEMGTKQWAGSRITPCAEP